MSAMKALVYLGTAEKALEERPKPEITAPADAIVKITKTTICGTDLHILKGNVPSCQPCADTSLYRIPDGADEDALVMLSDILPTGFECGVLNGKVQPASTVAIVGSGPIGLAALLTAQFYSPAETRALKVIIDA
jgi:threonine dehydrogenase-like Zn-dependent dehydrogenase